MTSDVNPKTVLLKGSPVINEALVDDADITPGMLVTPAGENIEPHGSAGGNAARLFALEGDFIGRGIDDNWEGGERARYGAFRSGDEVYAILHEGQNVTAEGTALVSAGNGRLQAFSAVGENVPVEAIVAYATEAVDATAAPARIRVRVA